jgi:hypothetical protein
MWASLSIVNPQVLYAYNSHKKRYQEMLLSIGGKCTLSFLQPQFDLRTFISFRWPLANTAMINLEYVINWRRGFGNLEMLSATSYWLLRKEIG